MEFQYDPAPQRSPEWLKRKRGKIGSSKLNLWLAVSKAKTGAGKPLKARLDYEKELMFERQFDTNFETWVSGAMQDGIDFEDFAREQYEKITGNALTECGCWYNDYFVASPDRIISTPENVGVGLVEIKILKDNSFIDVLAYGVPKKYWQQMQGQMWASGYTFCDFVAVNFNTKKVAIIRVEADPEFHAYLELSVQEKLVTEPFKLDEIHDIMGEIPDEFALAAISSGDGGWDS